MSMDRPTLQTRKKDSSIHWFKDTRWLQIQCLFCRQNGIFVPYLVKCKVRIHHWCEYVLSHTSWKVFYSIEEYSAKRGSSPIWFISRKMAQQDFVYHCWEWPAVTLKWLLHMLWISHHYETFTECRNEDFVAEIDTNSIFMICGLDPLIGL